MNKTFNPNYPIVIGLSGELGTGKTTLADNLAPVAQVKNESDETQIQWDHLFFASPLYEISAIKKGIEGEGRKDRVLYALHEVLLDVFGGSPLYGAPSYDRFTELVKEVYAMPIQSTGKPRSFMQSLGKLCREVKSDCFVKRIERKIKLASSQDGELDPIKLFVVSDVRLLNEAEMICNQPNGILIRLTADETTRRNRVLDRDGQEVNEEQMGIDNNQLLTIPFDMFDYILDTEKYDTKELTSEVKSIVKEFIGE